MKNFLYFLFAFPVFSNCTDMLIIDFNAKDKYTLFNLSREFEKNGYQVLIEPFYKDLSLDKFSTIFLNLSLEMLKNIESPFVEKILNQIKEWLSYNKSLGLIFPDLCFIEIEKTEKFINGIFENVNQYIMDFLSFNSFSSCQNTALLPKRDIKKFYVNPLMNLFAKEVVFLPNKLSLLERSESPIGLYWNFKANHIFISKTSKLLAQELNEDFRSNSINKVDRKKFKKSVKDSIKEFSKIAGNQKNINIQKIEIPQKKSNQIIYCGWGDLDNYYEGLEKKVDYILDSKLNIIWLQTELELYFGPNANKSLDKELFLEKLKNFTNLLTQRAYEKKCNIPKLLIGLNITSNLKSKEVKNCVVDFYGEKLDKIPSCIDFDFWKSEVIDVLNEFFKDWSKISNFLISGMFLDLEMYHAQDQASSYTNLLDFSNYAFSKYCDYKKLKVNLSKHEEMINYLVNNKLIDDYLIFIRNEAFKIGAKIKEFIFSKIETPIIGVYMMQLPHEAFYLGLCSGLSNAQDPIILATFNLEFLKHQNWLYAQNIFCKHLTVIMLSKFLSSKDIKLVEEISKDHDGIWFNRFSRLGSSYNSKAWWTTESTKMNHNLLIKKIGSYIENRFG